MAASHSYTSVPQVGSPRWLPTSAPTAVPEHRRYKYFIVRPNGNAVPLIPVDELPSEIQLQSVPRVLAQEETSNLQFVGIAPRPGAAFKLEGEPEVPSPYNGSRPSSVPPGKRHETLSVVIPELAASDTPHPARRINAPHLSAAATAKSWRRAEAPRPVRPEEADAQADITEVVRRTKAGAQSHNPPDSVNQDKSKPPLGKIPEKERKEYCTYWILHGDCAYVQQGCKFKHEMPTKEKLEKIGIRNTPKWWMEKMARSDAQDAKTGQGGKPHDRVKTKYRAPVNERGYGSELKATARAREKREVLRRRQEDQAKSQEADEDYERSRPWKEKQVSVLAPAPTTFLDPDEGQTLIDFAPLLPTPSTSFSPASANATTTVKARSSLKSARPAHDDSDRWSDESDDAKSSTSTCTAPFGQVFVPAGESPDAHITEATTRLSLRDEAKRTTQPEQLSSKHASPAMGRDGPCLARISNGSKTAAAKSRGITPNLPRVPRT